MSPSTARLAAIVVLGVTGPTVAADLSAVLECRDVTAIAADAATFAAYGRASGFDCRMHDRDRESMVYCTGAGSATAFGETVKEFNRVHAADGQRTLQVVFDKPPSAIEAIVAGARNAPGASEALSLSSVTEREDGVAELRCAIGGSGERTGSIAGTLDFRGVEPVPAMRVCAAAVRDPDRPTCVETTDGQRDYQIGRLEPGDYYVTAFALHNNPNRLFGVFTSADQDCPAQSVDCVGRLGRVAVFPGDVRGGINPSTLMARLPSPLRTESRMPPR